MSYIDEIHDLYQAARAKAIHAADEEAGQAMDAWTKAIESESKEQVAAARDAYYAASNRYHALLCAQAADEEERP